MSRDDARPDDSDSEDRWNDPEARWGDPEDRWGDPEDRWEDPADRWSESATDSVEIPTVDVPDTAGDGTPEVEVDSDLATTFWVTVVLVNVAVAGVCVGAMFVYFRGNTLVGGGAAAVGVFALVRAYGRYRDFRASRDGESAAEGVDERPDDSAGESSGDE